MWANFIILSFFQSETEEEIPIFIGSVPRYVSGISKKTSVSDVIKGELLKKTEIR